MKKTITILSAVFMAATLFAQDKASKADILMHTPDISVQREYLDISVVNKVSISVVYITNVSNNQKLSALDLEYKTSGDDAITTKVLLDPDETDALVAFLQNITDNISKTAAPKNYTEYVFTSRSNLEAGAYCDKTWKTYIMMDNENSKTKIEFDKEDLLAFVSFLRQAKGKM